MLFFVTGFLRLLGHYFTVMPLTPAERQKRYRERLKQENPDKFLLQKSKNAERTKKNRKKITEYPSSEQEMIRKQWRERKKKTKQESKPEKVPLHENEQGNEQIQKKNYNRRVIYKLKNENTKLKEEVKKYKFFFKKTRQRLNRIINKNNDLVKIIEKKNQTIRSLEETSSQHATEDQDAEKMTPSSKTCAYIEQNLPNIRQEEKETVKRVLLEHNVMIDTLKEGYCSKNTQQKRLLKNMFTKSKIIDKYSMKTKIATYLGLKGKIRQSKHKSKSSIIIETQLRKFYERDDISKMTAGKNEVKTKNKQKKQRRYLLGTLKKLYRKYREEGGKLSFTTFKRYRPFYILPPKAEKRETCACKRHENLQMKATVLKSLGLLDTIDLDELLGRVVCSLKLQKCAYGECDICKNKRIDFSTIRDQSQSVSWDEWVLKSHEYKPKRNCELVKITKKNDLEKKTGSLKILLVAFQEELQNFKIHSYNIIHQYKNYRNCIENLDNRSVALHIDFSENYACKLSTEIQAMHFDGSRQQITLHTGVLYTNKGHKSFASLSPNHDHGPDAIWAHLLPVLTLIKQKLPEVDGIHFFSDGPTVQYRQKKNFYYFSKLTKELGFKFSTWNFFEASHGKGAADGIGGAIKRKLDSIVAYGSNVRDAKTAFEYLQASETKIQLFFIAEDAMLNDSVELIPVPNTMKVHQIINNVDSANSILYRYLSCFCQKNRPGFCDCFNVKSANLLKKTTLTGEKATTSKTSITVLSDIKNTKENKSYFDLSQYGPFNLKQMDLKADLTIKTSKENSGPFHDRMNLKKNYTKKRKVRDKYSQKCKKRKVESSTDEDDMSISVHDTSDEEYHVTDDENYLDNINDEMKKQESEIRETSDTGKIIVVSENERMAETNFAEHSDNGHENYENLISSDKWRLCFQDTVLVRYYQRGSWKYYIGFLEDSYEKDTKSYFKIRFLKTIKKPVLKFAVQKLRDEDTVTEDHIVKQVKIIQNTKLPKEYFLVNPSDKIYFE